MSTRVLHGDALAVLRTLDAGSVQCCVTSPPYFNLRSYLPDGHPDKAMEIGGEATPDQFIARLVGVFAEVRRVLRDDGTMFVNIGDSYNGGGLGGGATKGSLLVGPSNRERQTDARKTTQIAGLKPKDLIGIPWMLAFALRADGWYLRSDIIWHKPSPMPESVTDRPTSAHEHVFLLAKNATYFYDADAIAEPSCAVDNRAQTKRARELYAAAGLTEDHIAALRACGVGDAGKAQTTQSGYGKNTQEVMRLAAEAKSALGGYTREFLISDTRNARNVWTISTSPFPGAHFATMPPDLAERCIKAGSRVGNTILDPFAGAGTTGLVADRFGRDAVLIDLSDAYGEMQRARITDDAPLFAQVSA